MAGGPHAAAVACMTCLNEGKLVRAERVYEGVEDDHYLCEAGHTFGIDWSREAATEPQWPPPPELVAFAKSQAAGD